MTLEGVVLLAARTSRSQAYAQALATAGLAPQRVILFGEGRTLPELPARAEIPGLFLPDLSVPLEETIGQAGWECEAVDGGSVNDPGVVARLRAAAPRLVVYSGYGGQIVGAQALGVAPFLHLHAGWLPEERGSTTLYYGILGRRRCGVSALLLAPSIDTGPILARRHYPVPPAGVDVDHLYDGAVRADLLVAVLRRLAESGELPSPSPQDAQAGETYYVIHPVLKHLALLSLVVSEPCL